MQYLRVRNGLQAARGVENVGSDGPSKAAVFSVLVDRVESGPTPIDPIAP